MKCWDLSRTQDPNEMEGRFAQEDGIGAKDSIFSEPGEEDLDQINRVLEVIDFLPPREADFVDLYFLRRLKQTEIALMFGVSQPTVCYRLSRAAARIRFLLLLPKINEADLTRDLAGFLPDPLDIRIMVLMWKEICQSEVARQLDVSQGLVRHRFLKTLHRMRRVPNFAKYVAVFDYIAGNLNIVREIRRHADEDSIVYSVC